MSETKGYVGFDVKHLRRDKCGGSTLGDRRRILNEYMRELDAKNLHFQAERNPNINVLESHRNIAFVNNGKGGIRRAKSVDEVLDYQSRRMEKLVTIRKDSYETSLFVVHLPKSMCKEVPAVYKSVVDGEEIERSRWVERDYQEAQTYLKTAMFWLADNFIPGGRDAIAGGDINFDESTPHIQFMADTFSPDDKEPGMLRCRPGLSYGTDKSVRYTSGPKYGQQISREFKMHTAHKGLREHMHSLGYPVELHVSERAGESMVLERYQEIEDQKRAVAKREQRVAEAETILQEDREFAARQGFDDGVHMGRKEGFDRGLDEAQAETQAARDVAAADRQAAAQELQQARETVQRQVESARRQARQEAEEEARAIKAAAQAERAQAADKLDEANNLFGEAAQEREEAELEKSAAASDRAAAATELDKAKTVHEKAKREAQSFLKTSREQTMIQARRDVEAAKADREAAAADRTQAAQERATVQAEADGILAAAQSKAAEIVEQAKKKALAGAKAVRDHMLVVDSEFLDYMLKQPGVQDMYDKFVERAFSNPILGGNPVMYGRTVAEDKAFIERQKRRSAEAQERRARQRGDDGLER